VIKTDPLNNHMELPRQENK